MKNCKIPTLPAALAATEKEKEKNSKQLSATVGEGGCDNRGWERWTRLKPAAGLGVLDTAKHVALAAVLHGGTGECVR